MWTENINPGDKVIYVLSHHSGMEKSILTVIRTTKTLIVCRIGKNAEAEFKKINGRSFGKSAPYCFSRIEPYDENEANKINLKNQRKILQRRVERFDFNTLDSESMMKINEVLDDVSKSNHD